MSVRHANISIFVPHIGCPNMCSFCNQRYITGCDNAPDADEVCRAVLTATQGKNYDPQNTEIAFFGGSFTSIDRNYMTELLATAYEFVKVGVVSGIRVSTRPDAIDDNVLQILKRYGVTAIELGAQSLDDTVLLKNNRGHNAECVYKAAAKIKENGFSLGLQMMTGLYGDSDETCVKTLERVIELSPDTLRIYPAIVLKDTELEKLYSKGEYKPQTLEDAVELCAILIKMLENTDIKLIRLGLHTIDEGSFVAGPWHPAFSELCHSQLFLNELKSQLTEKGSYVLYTNPRNISKLIGQRRSNINRLRLLGFNCRVVGDSNITDGKIIIERSDI